MLAPAPRHLYFDNKLSHHYRAFGLVISSNIPLPELKTTDSTQADVCIVFGNTPSQLHNSSIKKPNWQANKSQLLLNLSKAGIGKFLIENSNKITIDALPNTSLDSLRLFLLGSAFGALLYQRKQVVLHASTLTQGKGAIIICGVSGAGKSTTANALVSQGWQIMSDDLSVVDCINK